MSLSSCSAVVLTSSVRSSSSFSLAAASASCVSGAVITLTRESASATTLSWPEMWRLSVLNCEMKSRWLNWRGEHLSLFWWKAKVSGLWSVRMVKCRASSM